MPLNGGVISLKQYIKAVLMMLAVFVCDEAIGARANQCVLTSNIGQSDTNAWWIKNALLSHNSQHKQFMSQIRKHIQPAPKNDFFPVNGHLLSKGTGDVLFYRDLFKGWPGRSDSSGLVQISIATPKPLGWQGEVSVGGSSGVMVFFTTGSPGLHDFCMGYAKKGTIRYTASARGKAESNDTLRLLGAEDGLYAEISLEVDMVDPEGLWPEKCDRCIFDANLLVRPETIMVVNKALAP